MQFACNLTVEEVKTANHKLCISFCFNMLKTKLEDTPAISYNKIKKEKPTFKNNICKVKCGF